MSKSAKLVIVLGLVLGLSVAILPQCTYAVIGWTSVNVMAEVGVSKYLGISSVEHTQGTDVEYTDGAFSKTFSGSEFMTDFGTTTMRISCNYCDNDENGGNCINGWQLTAQSGTSTTSGNKTYATMVGASEHVISSSSTTVNGTASTWTLKASGVTKTFSEQNFAPTIPATYSKVALIPVASTPIAHGSTFQTIGGQQTYIGDQEVKVQYGISISPEQAAGTYNGTVNYTVLLENV